MNHRVLQQRDEETVRSSDRVIGGIEPRIGRRPTPAGEAKTGHALRCL